MAAHLQGTAPIETPAPALAMYAANDSLAMARWPAQVKWSDDLKDALLRQFRDLKDNWKFDPEPDVEWNWPTLKVSGDRTFWEGNCNDFAPQLLLRFNAIGVPRGALRLLLCRFDGRGHMVLAVDTTRGTKIACNLAGIWDHRHPTWAPYEWLAWEGHRAGPLGWQSLRPLTLSAALDGADAPS